MTQKLSFSSPGEAGGVEEAKRLARWWDEYCARFGGSQMGADRELPFATKVEQIGLGDFGLGVSSGSINRFYRRPTDVARYGDDGFRFLVNRGGSPTKATTGAKQFVVEPGCAALFDFTLMGELLSPGGHHAVTLTIPRRLLRNVMAKAEDLGAVVIRPDNDALRLFVRYSEGALEGEALTHPAVLAQAGQNLLDLVVLAFGSDRDNVEASRLGGLRAARLDAALRLIRAEYSDPAISAARVAARLGISARYLHELLQETGVTFATRVQELRLERAFTLLSGETRASRKVHDAAYDAGFSDLSFFNRQFRKKYGITPTAARGRER